MCLVCIWGEEVEYDHKWFVLGPVGTWTLQVVFVNQSQKTVRHIISRKGRRHHICLQLKSGYWLACPEHCPKWWHHQVWRSWFGLTVLGQVEGDGESIAILLLDDKGSQGKALTAGKDHCFSWLNLAIAASPECRAGDSTTVVKIVGLFSLFSAVLGV